MVPSARPPLFLLSALLLALAACEAGDDDTATEADDESTAEQAPDDPDESDDADEPDEPDEPDDAGEAEEPGEAGEGADEAEDDAAAGNPAECVDEAPDGGVFVDEADFRHADHVEATYEDTHKLLEIATPLADQPERFALVQCGLETPELDDDVHVIEVPVESAVTLTTTNLPHFDALDAVDRLAGVGEPDFVATPSVRDRIEDGELEGYGTAEGGPDLERVIDLGPDLLILDAFGEDALEQVQRLTEAGVPALLNGDFDETTLLGRAEWVKVTGMLLNREAEAEAVFDEVAAGYEEVRDHAADLDDRPLVLADEPFEGTWFAAGGESFLANGISDAGGEYAFADDDSTGSLEFDIETVLDEGGDAHVWIQAGSVDGTLDDLLAVDERFAEIRAFQEGEVWAADAQATPTGGNARFEGAYLYADEFLADLAAIFHPDEFDHEPVFFGRVEE
ncbi:hypothetical protein ER308_18685 [Egibacter rhizosphaerae]|uniref:Fe/B12 periplasmic-binding domain-containing protein n=1 Tax=Egibacter rhizosphaerae TaxID=1670831 RepID=A0A411YJN3_9ACTN|nr:ABC transporter substrate-binding protein [Egibacter rhizosphaerae]QBI21392.1 hypothetical protein ER308_18685 [Egibacter rhizosphaerae]